MINETENLWNCTNKKYKKTINYINNLNCNDNWPIKAKEYFYKEIKYLKTLLTANDILKEIGYKYKKQSSFITKCFNIKD